MNGLATRLAKSQPDTGRDRTFLAATHRTHAPSEPSVIDEGSGMVVLSYSNSFVFIANPKAGSNSIEAVLARYQEYAELNDLEAPGLFTRQHLPAAVLRSMIGNEAWSGLNSFAVIRNPYDWWVSQFSYNLGKLGERIDTDKLLGEDAVRRCLELMTIYRGQECSPTGTQWAFLCDCTGRLLVNQLLRFDSLAKDFRWMCSSLRLKHATLPHMNRTPHPHWTAWLSATAKRMIESIYAADFEIYESASRGPD